MTVETKAQVNTKVLILLLHLFLLCARAVMTELKTNAKCSIIAKTKAEAEKFAWACCQYGQAKKHWGEL